ncbi:MAG: LemA family protein [Candidatus Woesebacteria bacterium GW2011_GWB1_43_14]|uniref:LemA family protein n=1 Tax=Candidatus Woesebacteria bacterium GW2011_GWB1_43_14 TaxID=1618578 RepID=A0A0G1DHT3_9BACT|nr:MAG: LemA family protein [Candidatus Woesebacteria bacterium GW2011_GWA1_39_11b]KKS78467.1 MAG: LemA family protein [Candidatus Woesebacteria bacterium GW2011_GWC1_42_9]KKS97117.1 MAG: LemA family protein [Candidatus Woesebacteria bacterium GW2011_GWB1_43_14]
MQILLLPLVLLVVVGIWVAMTYNFFVSSKARIKAAVQEIGNQLKRQADLIPNLESSAKGFLKHEKGIFKELAEARKAISAAVKSRDVQKMADAGSRLAGILPSLKIAVEDNPEIKGSEVVVKLMDELRDTSDKIMYARRLVIDLTADYNVRRVSLPSNIVANMFGFSELPGLITPESGEHVEVSQSEMKSPKVNL